MGTLIRGIGAYVPENHLSNEQISSTVDTTPQWISQKTGILERRICPPEVATSDVAYEAAIRCLENAGVKPTELSLIIVATSSPDQIQPAVACMVQERLGIGASHCPAFDINSVCAGFVYALQVGQSMIQACPGQYQNVLVIGADVYSKILNWEDRTTCVYFGDGSGAVLLSASDLKQQEMQFLLGSDGRGNQLIGIPAGGTRTPVDEEVLARHLNKFTMAGRKVWEFATTTIAPTIQTLLERNGLTPQDLDLVVLHQANLRLIEHIINQLGLSMEKTETTVAHYGNTAAASIPITLDKAFKAGKLFPGAKVMLCGFGGGLSWGAALIEW